MRIELADGASATRCGDGDVTPTSGATVATMSAMRKNPT
jgi:hypothetical protein